jgi:ATP-dependent DNA helicase PIF1
MAFQLDPTSQAAFDAMRNTYDNILLLGKAGTGKSTLISNYIRDTQKSKNKNIAVVAPTGVAAMNIGGQTIHSFFKFSINVTTDDARQRATWHRKQKIFQVLETLIIDEISMVRADLLDCIDVFLRVVRKNQQPFGGVQVIMV